MNKLALTVLVMFLLAALAGCRFFPSPPAAPTAQTTPAAPRPPAFPSGTPDQPLNSPNGPALRSINMFTPLDGWGLINNALLITQNGGLTWFPVSLPEGQVDEFTRPFFVDARTVYMVVPAPDGNTGQLYRTTNGGGTWKISPVPFIQGQLVFIDQVGYFLQSTRTGSDAMLSVIFTSLDDGLTWNMVVPDGAQPGGSNLPETGPITGISFINSGRGWLCVADQPQKIALFKTEDGGRNWAPQSILAPQNIASMVTTTLPPIFFAGNMEAGLLPVDFTSQGPADHNLVFYSTRDGGSNWSPGASVVAGRVYTFVNPATGWAWGSRGLYFTNDGARSWQLLPVAFGPSEQAASINFVDEKTGWLLTTDATNRVRIYNSHDGGSTWAAINP